MCIIMPNFLVLLVN